MNSKSIRARKLLQVAFPGQPSRAFTATQGQSARVDYKSFVGQFFRDQETQSRDMELSNLIGIINSKEKVDFKSRFEKIIRMREGQMTEEETEQLQREEQIMKEKILAVEKSKVYVNFFNKPALKLIKKSKH